MVEVVAMEYGDTQKLPISQSIVEQMSLSTIRNTIDAIVELVTNSDDSYMRLEQDHVSVNGNISVFIQREKGGSAKSLLIRDNAEGMDRPSLEKAIEFAEPASGIKEGKTVRGYFGRGLKEAIIALGKGRIDTIRNEIYDSAELWWETKQGQYRLLKQPEQVTADIRKKTGISEGNGTVVTIDIKNPKMTCPEYKSFNNQLTCHYALRDINLSPERNVKLIFSDWTGVTTTAPISYLPPDGELIDGKSVVLDMGTFTDKIQVKVYKSEEQLDSPRYNPYAKAGFLIRTEGAILDLQLFKFDDNEAGLYFFGDVFCPGIVKMIKADEQGLVDTNRGGLEWKHPYCQKLRTSIEAILNPYIKEKEKELEKKVSVEVSENTKKALNKLCNLLNRFAKDEIELAKGMGTDSNIFELMIKPEYANLEINEPRLFSVYVPGDLWDLLDKGEKLYLESNSPNIYVAQSEITASELSIHPKYSEILYGHFEAFGDMDGADGKLVCKLGQYSAFANVKVAEPQKSKKKKTLSGKWHGLFSGIKPDETLNPIQRVKYDSDTGEIIVYVNFPAVNLYIGSGLKGAETSEGKIVLAELVSEAFCRYVATKRRELGKDIYFPGAEIDGFNNAVNILQRKYLHHIHKAMAS